MAFDVNGKAHRILTRLTEGEAYYQDLIEAVGFPLPLTRQHRKKLNRFIDCMIDAGLLDRDGRGFVSGDNAAEALAQLEAGQPYVAIGRPSVRYFVARDGEAAKHPSPVAA